jgi:hypothetical protein
MTGGPLLEPKDETITGPDGVERTFVFSKFPAVLGREIVAKYPVSTMPKIGDYEVSEATMLKLMSCVAARPDPDKPPIRLSTRALVDNHTHDWETLARIEIGMMEYNCSFFGNGKSLDFFAKFAETVKVWISSTLTDLLAASSVAAKPPSTNSEPSTP